jgi:hypothetical protein
MSSSAWPKPCRIAPSFARSILTNILLVLLAIMIVRDSLVRRFRVRSERPGPT